MDNRHLRIGTWGAIGGLALLLSGCGDPQQIACEKQVNQRDDRQVISMAARKNMVKSCMESSQAASRETRPEGRDR